MTTTAGDLVTDAVVSISGGLAAGSDLVVDTGDETVSCIESWAA